MRFTELGISAPILRAITEAGYEAPTPIQEKAIPAVLAGRDLLGCAQTGTGKTAAFAIPIIQRLCASGRRDLRALILTPTRELALQIYENVCQYARYTPCTAAVIFGGVSQIPQVEALERGVDLLIATPGRLWDLMNQKIVRLDRIECFVLDEADRMLDMGFINDVKKIVKCIPKKRQTLLFSATMPPEIASLADSLLYKPARISVTPTATPVELIEQQVYFVERSDKRTLLKTILHQRGIPQTLIFTRTKHGADRVARDLSRAGISAKALHGDKSQGARQTALREFKECRIAALVATDIAARGIDINELPLVINFELPNIPETYVHRIGRTGRAGQEGVAISFCDPTERPYLADIEKLIRQSVPVVGEVSRDALPAPTEVKPEPQNRRRGRRGAVETPIPAVEPRGRRSANAAAQPEPESRQSKLRRRRGSVEAVQPAPEPQPSKPRRRRGGNVVEAVLPAPEPQPSKPRRRRGGNVVEAVLPAPEPQPGKPRRRGNETAAASSKQEKRGRQSAAVRRREREPETRVDVATPADPGRISDETMARIRAKVAAKLAERASRTGRAEENKERKERRSHGRFQRGKR